MAEQTLTLAQVTTMFQEMMQTLVSEIRKPPYDKVKEAQKKREEETKVKALAEFWAKKAAKKKNCLHSRQDGNCCIAWATQSDGVTRGYCPNCDSVFTPEDGEIYTTQIRRPRGLMESVRVIA